MNFLDEKVTISKDTANAAEIAADLEKQGVDSSIEEANAFLAAADAAKDAGETEFEFPKGSGKMHKVTLKNNLDLEEGKISKFLGGLALSVAALSAMGSINKSDSVLQAIDSQIELADTKAEKLALKKMADHRIIWLDTGKGPGGDISVDDVKDVIKELSEKSCGCGQTPCKTYGKVSESLGDALEGGIKDFISGRKMDFVSMAKGLEKIKELNLTPEEEELFKNTLGKIKKGEEPFKKDSKEEKNFFKLCVKAKLDKKEIELIKEAIKAIRDKNSTNENMNEDKDTVELPSDTTFTLDLKHLMKKHMDKGNDKESAIKFTKALMKKLHDKGEVEVDGTKILFKEIKDIKNIKAIIQQAKVNRDKAIKGGNEGMADKIEGNLLKKLQDLNYDFKKDPDAMEVLGDFLDLDEADIPMDTPLALPEPEVKKPRRKGPPRLVAFDTNQDSHFTGEDNYDYEGSMAKSQMLKMKKYAIALCDMIEDESQLESWLQAKITKASDYMSSVYHYLDYQRSKMNEETLNEEAFNFPQADQYTLRKSKWGGEDGVGLDMPSSSKYREKDTDYILLKDTPFDNIDDLFNAFKEKLSNPNFTNDVFKRFANQTNGMILKNLKLNEADKKSKYELNNRPVGDFVADGGGSTDPFIGAAYYLDGKGEKLSDEEVEDLIDKYPGDLEPGGTWWNERK